MNHFTDPKAAHTINTFLTKYIQLSYLQWIKYFGLPISVTCPVYRLVKDEDSSLGVGLKWI